MYIIWNLSFIVYKALGAVKKLEVRQCGNCGRRLMSTSSQDSSVPLIPLPEVKRFIIDAMTKVGTPQANASQLADVLAAADYRGHYSHGLNRLGKILAHHHSLLNAHYFLTSIYRYRNVRE